ncbi:F-box/WD repeat-containing protein 7 [Arapaima gigas]
MSRSMCGCGCSILSSLMKRLGRSACCSDLLSCRHAPEHLQCLAAGCPPPPKVVLRGPWQLIGEGVQCCIQWVF